MLIVARDFWFEGQGLSARLKITSPSSDVTCGYRFDEHLLLIGKRLSDTIIQQNEAHYIKNYC